MTDDKLLQEAVIVASGHLQRIEGLEAKVVLMKAEQADVEAVRAEAVLLLGRLTTFDGDAQQLRREADRSLGMPAEFLVMPVPLSNSMLSWDGLVATNRLVLTSEGKDPDSVCVSDLIDPDTLAQIDAEWEQFSRRLDAQLDEQAIDALTSSCRRAVLDAVIRPLGLGRLVERVDFIGGSVLTPHNAEAAWQGKENGAEMANQEHLREFSQRKSEAYNHKDYEAGLSELRKQRFQDEAPLRDDYAPHRELPRDGRTHVDHIIPAKQIHEHRDVNFFLSAEQQRKLAVDERNLAWTDSSLNQSKGDSKLSDWMERERRDGMTNADRYGIDREAALREEREAEDHLAHELVEPKVKYYCAQLAMAGTVDALKMGLQQAIGAVFVELTVGLFDEVADLWRNGRQNDSLLSDFVARAKRVGERVLTSWRDIVDRFKQGALAGFLSTLLTTIINSVVTTGKRLVRIIREGLLSLYRGVKMLVFPPPGLDVRQASHAASKLITAGVATAAGIAVEEAVEKAIVSAMPALAPIASLLSVTSVGLATGLASVLLVASLDRFDFFGVVARERGESRLAAMRERTDSLLDTLLHANHPTVL